MNTEKIVNPKCGSCKCFWKPDETDVKSSSLICKTCKKCREIQKQKRLNKKKKPTHINTNLLDMLNDDLLDDIFKQVHQYKLNNVMKDLKGYFNNETVIKKHREKYINIIHLYQFEEDVLFEDLIDNKDKFFLWLYQQNGLPNKDFFEMYCLRLLENLEFFYYIGVFDYKYCFDINNIFNTSKMTVKEYFIFLEEMFHSFIKQQEEGETLVFT